jgi:hypothetical protein
MILTVALTIGRVSNDCMVLQNQLERICMSYARKLDSYQIVPMLNLTTCQDRAVALQH